MLIKTIPYSFIIGVCLFSTLSAMQGDTTKEKIVIGVDVGGTHTDAVLLKNVQLLAKHKTVTTPDITSGVMTALSALFEKDPQLKERVTSVNIGTTHLLNALLQTTGLCKPLVVRLSAPAATAVPPALDWDAPLKEALLNEIYVIEGGYEYSGNEIAPLDEEAVRHLAQVTIDKNIDSVAITGVFSNVNPQQEKRAKEIFKRINPRLTISLSHTLGDLGLLARENATILNACLAKKYTEVRNAFVEAVNHLGIKATVFLTQGDGTKTLLGSGSSTPLRTLHSGPINSIKGAALLAKIEDAVTVDVGGTSTDIGILKRGEPVNENAHFTVAGVRCNFSRARLHSCALGGGSIIHVCDNGTVEIGPESIGKDLSTKAIVFGGNTFTVTDCAVLLGRLNIGILDRNTLKEKIILMHQNVDELIERIDKALHAQLAQGITQVLDALEDIPSTLVLVGGGARLFNTQCLHELLSAYRFNSVIIPESADVANALGAALSLIPGENACIYDYSKVTRNNALAQATAQAKKCAIDRGADPDTIKVTSVREIPFTYLKGDPNHITVEVKGHDTGNYQFTSETSQSLQSQSNSQSSTPGKLTKNYYDAALEITSGARQAQQEGMTRLTAADIDDIARGAAFLGSGGGGSPELGRLMALNVMRQGGIIQKISFDNLPDDALVIVFGGMGSPTIFSERLASLKEGILAITEIEKKMGKKVSALLLGEIAGANATYPLFVAAVLGIPVIDADTMGRAFPSIHMSTANIYGTFDEHYTTLSNGQRSEIVQAESFFALGNKARTIAVEMGGSVSVACFPMTGAQAKQWSIKGTLSIAQAMGKAMRQSQGQTFASRLDVLNAVLATTEYKKAERVFSGKITNVRRKESGGCSIGGFVVDNAKEAVEIAFQNENLCLRKRDREVLVLVPDLIIVVDKNTFQPISCEELRYGQEVVILKMNAPALMTTEKAKAIVGTQAYPLEEIFKLLSA